MLRRGEAKAAGGRQLGFADDADDESEALRAQAFLHGPQRIGGARRLGEQPGRRLEAQGGKAVPVRRTELAGKDGRPAPQDARRTWQEKLRCFADAARRGASAKPSAAAQLPAASASDACGSAFTSCREAASRPRLRRWSTSAAPSVHRATEACAASSGEEEEAMREEPRSSAVMRWRSSASTPALLSSQRPAPRNGEEGLAVPVRARAPRPNATQPVTRTRTGAWLWPRDPLQTAGRWGGGWGRLVHGNALATTEATAARMPSRSFFVLAGTAIQVKIKKRTNIDN